MTITYNHGTIDALLAEVRASSGKLGGQLEDLKGYLQNNVGEWTGESAGAYKEHQANWDRAALALHEMLAKVERAATEGNVAMANADRRAAQGWG